MKIKSQASTHCGYRYKQLQLHQSFSTLTSLDILQAYNSRLYDFCCRGGRGKLSQRILSHVTSNPSVPYFLINNVSFSNMLCAMIIQIILRLKISGNNNGLDLKIALHPNTLFTVNVCSLCTKNKYISDFSSIAKISRPLLHKYQTQA